MVYYGEAVSHGNVYVHDCFYLMPPFIYCMVVCNVGVDMKADSVPCLASTFNNLICLIAYLHACTFFVVM